VAVNERGPEEWLKHLYRALARRRNGLNRLANYYDGVHRLAFSSKKFKQAFGGLFEAFADNWCEVVVRATQERLNVTGFRVGDNPSADGDAWSIWQANELDLQSQLAHTDALALGVSYVTTWFGDRPKTPEITCDSAMGTIVAAHPKLRRRRLAALRCYLDDEAFEHAELFLPDAVYVYRSHDKRDVDRSLLTEDVQWMVDPDNDEADETTGEIANPLGVVPVVELRNRPRLTLARGVGIGAHSELTSIIPLQDAVNKLIADMLLASEFASFPQRWATGYEDTAAAEGDPGAAAEKFKSGPGAFWWLEDPDAKFGQFQAADLSNYVEAVAMIVQHIASISATPPHYLTASADRLSGESLKSAETGLVAKVRSKQTCFAEPWEETVRIAGAIAGVETLTGATAMETIWSDPESRTEGEHVDAALKKQALGVPQEQLWEDLGYSPQQIARFKAMRATDALLGGLGAMPATVPAPATNGNGERRPLPAPR
jgi:hypothetical protein